MDSTFIPITELIRETEVNDFSTNQTEAETLNVGPSSSAQPSLRTSSYVIYVDLPDDREEMLLVHGYTGAYDKVSNRVASYLRSLETRKPPKPLYGVWSPEVPVNGYVPPPSEETIRILRRRGYLTNMSVGQEEGFFRTLAEKIHKRNSRRMTYIFMPSYDCNLRCAYCFQDHMRTNPHYRHLLRTMSKDVVDSIFRGLSEIEALHDLRPGILRHRSVGFFGGEPLLASNLLIIKYIIEAAKALGTASFWAISNATELDSYTEVLTSEGISRIQITLDGPPVEHDKRRIYSDGSGSFAKIARNLSMALDRGVTISVRMNVDRNNLFQLTELAEVIHAHRWDSYKNFSAYAAPIRAENEKVIKSTTMDTWELDEALTELTNQFPILSLIQKLDDGIRLQARRLFRGAENMLPDFRESYCSAHTGMYIFDAFADIYACWERTGDPSIRIGHINENGSLDLDKTQIDMWRSRTVASNPVCSKCRYALSCGGGCAVLALGKTGKYHMNYCDGFASRFRANVARAYVEHKAGVAMTSEASRICDQ